MTQALLLRLVRQSHVLSALQITRGTGSRVQPVRATLLMPLAPWRLGPPLSARHVPMISTGMGQHVRDAVSIPLAQA